MANVAFPELQLYYLDSEHLIHMEIGWFTTKHKSKITKTKIYPDISVFWPHLHIHSPNQMHSYLQIHLTSIHPSTPPIIHLSTHLFIKQKY